MKGLAYALGAGIIAIAVGIRDLASTIQLVATAVISGVEWAVRLGRKPALQYLKGLQILLRLTFIPPLIVGPVAFLFGWQPTMGWTGVWLVVWTVIVGHYGVLLGLLIDALGTIGRTGTWTAGKTGFLAQRLKGYISFVRQVLIYETATFAVLNLVPFQNWWAAVPLFFLIVGLLIVTSYEWATGTGKWLKPIVRVASFTALGILLLGFIVPSILPKVNFFHMFWYLARGEKIPEKDVYSGTRDLQTTDVWSLVLGIGKWVGEHWIGVAVAVAVVLLLTYLLVKLFKKAATPAAGTVAGGSVHHATTTSSHGSGGKSWLGMAALGAVIILCLGWLALQVMDFDHRRSARLEAGERDAQLNEEARAAMRARASRLVAEGNGRTATQTQVAPPVTSAPTEWCGLRNPTMHTFQFTTNWSRQIPRPAGMSVRTAPSSLDPEIRINGAKILRIGPRGTEFPPETRYIEFRAWTSSPLPVEMTVGVGNEAH